MSTSFVDGGVTAARGFRASAVTAGIKKPRNDLAILMSDTPAAVAGVFTTNRIQAAPVHLCRERTASGRAQAVIVNSGCANACTGAQGVADAHQMAALAAQALGIPESLVLVCSTGTIGVLMPMDKVAAAVPAAAAALSPDGGPAAAKAIMTTDTVDKQVAVRLTIGGRDVTIGGMTKGAGMIDPNMATMLAFLTTDAAVEPAALRACLVAAVEQSFNRISVDGDQSTNDTALLFANGASGAPLLNERHPEWPAFTEAVNTVTRELALKIVRDGEGVTRVVTLAVRGAASPSDASKAARAIANSLLVKTSWFGGDPNWGRVIAAVGYSGAAVKEELVDISYDGIFAFQQGRPAGKSVLPKLEEVLRRPAFSLTVDLHLGDAAYTMYTADCSEEYVRINAEYMT